MMFFLFILPRRTLFLSFSAVGGYFFVFIIHVHFKFEVFIIFLSLLVLKEVFLGLPQRGVLGVSWITAHGYFDILYYNLFLMIFKYYNLLSSILF